MRGRGRPPKNAVNVTNHESEASVKQKVDLKQAIPSAVPKRGRGRPPKAAVNASNGESGGNVKDRGKGSMTAPSKHVQIDEASLGRRSSHGDGEEDGGEKRNSKPSENSQSGSADDSSKLVKDIFDNGEVEASSYVYPPWLPQPDPRAKVAFLRAHRKDKGDPMYRPRVGENCERTEDEHTSNYEAIGHQRDDNDHFAATNAIAPHTLYISWPPRNDYQQPIPDKITETIPIDANSMDALIRGSANISKNKESNENKTETSKNSKSKESERATDSQATPTLSSIDSDIDSDMDCSLTELCSDDSKRRMTRGMLAKSRESQEYIWDKYVQKIAKTVETSTDGFWV